MPIRAVKNRYSDRGSIKDLTGEPEVPPSAAEVRSQKLYEYARNSNDKSLQSALGFITTDYIADKNALPLSVYRLRQTIADIKSKSSSAIDQFSQEIEQNIVLFIAPEAKAYWDNKAARGQVKTASVRKPPVFRRVSRQ